MQLRLLPLAFAIVTASLILAPSALAAGPNDATPGNRWVDATFTLTQPDLRTIQLSGDLLFYEYDIENVRYTADDMGEAFVNANTFAGPAKGEDLVGKIEAQARSSLEQTLAAAFPTATRTVAPAVVDRTTLVSASGNRFDPGVRVTVSATIARTNADLGLGDYSDEAVAAVFGAGAKVSSTFSLSSQPGYSSVYRIGAPASPSGLAFAAPSGEGASLSADARTLVVAIDNTAGSQTATRSVSVQVEDATAQPPTAEDLRTSVEISLGELKAGVASLPIATAVKADLRAIDLGQRFPGVLPASVELSTLSADALRALVSTGAIKDADLERAEETLLRSIRENLTASLKSPVTVTGGFTGASLAAAADRPYDEEPPVVFAADALGAYPLEGEGAENLDLALRIGAKVSFDLDLFASKSSASEFVLNAPPGVSFLKAEKGTLAAGGKSARYSVPAAGEGSAAFPVSLTMGATGAPAYTKEKADLGVVVDLQDLDISIGKAIGGDLGELVISVKVTGELGVIKVPDDVKASFDGRLDLEYLSSDAIRLLRERGLLSEENLSKLEAEMMKEVKANLGSALGADVTVTGGFDRASLDPKLVSSPISGDNPVVFNAQTSFRKSLSGAPTPQAAIALYTQQQTFALPKVQGLDTAYTVILPYGLAVTDLQVEGGSKETGESADGRDQFTVRPSDDEATATVSMAVTPSFVFAKFWPVLLLAAMVLILLVGSPIAFVVMRRNKKKAKAAGKQK